MTASETDASNRKKLEPVGWEDQMCFVDYADKAGELKNVKIPVYDIPTYCEALRGIRIDKKMTLMQAAKALKLTPAELSGIEHGRLECLEEEAFKFAQTIYNW